MIIVSTSNACTAKMELQLLFQMKPINPAVIQSLLIILEPTCVNCVYKEG